MPLILLLLFFVRPGFNVMFYFGLPVIHNPNAKSTAMFQ